MMGITTASVQSMTQYCLELIEYVLSFDKRSETDFN